MRRPNDWDGKLISKDGVHPSAIESAGPATIASLKEGGYLARLGYVEQNDGN